MTLSFVNSWSNMFRLKAKINVDVSSNPTDPNFKPPTLKILRQLWHRKFFTLHGLVYAEIY